jgi:hypothetical protein
MKRIRVGEHLVPRMACGRHWYQCPFGMIEILFPACVPALAHHLEE